jgi:hypothetical protein
MRKLLALTVAVVLGGCGSTDNGMNGTDGGHDMSASADFSTVHDFSTPVDLTTGPDFSGISCGPSLTCTGSDVCCATQNGSTASYMCQPSCADGGITIACQGPDNCKTAGNPICCATLTTNGGTAPFCNISAQASCASTCTTIIPTSCNMQMGEVRLCHRGSDCAADSQNPNCCLFTYNGNNVTFCADNTVKGFAAMCYP